MTKERKTLSDSVIQRFMTNPGSVEVDQAANTVSLTAIRLPTKRQPRRYFDAEKMAQLVASVREHGVLEPVLVRPLGDGNYELIAGERRLRAAQEVGLTQVPIVSREFSDQEALQVALMENLQRDDLNPIEETEAVLELLAIALDGNVDEVKSVIYQAANAKNRGHELKINVSLQLEKIESYLAELGRFNLESFRSSRLPLLNLPSHILDALREGKLEYTKARTIARVKDEQHQHELLEQAIAQGLSLNEIKAKIKEFKTGSEPEVMPERALVGRMTEITKRLKKSKAWNERKKRERINKLLDELERLTGED
ncbi:ParB/RepB/Spo0J family partition protein [Trichocoleus sp. FACHB-591]|uniref:ParB/RepB/Spo0J family partition protein n=1 Tax=Trichocoleus sp. FACHB-591 TaxID=2692872 RepID=UPI00168529AE|nr:ParB/RepB/Spo0J family partition protein [Trichocoleus sp. FACHB-591]MBD2095891.1 ParB/RepB/Spo0J family partition protein [Trichocoleus sp. FACHB-591]